MAVAMTRHDLAHYDASPSTGYAVVIPLVSSRPSAHTYVRRRVVAGLVILGVAVAIVVALGALTGRGGDPASAATTRPDVAAAPLAAGAAGSAAPAAAVYVVRSGDTLWSIAAQLRGAQSQNAYVDALIKLNGGTRINAGQALRLPAARG